MDRELVARAVGVKAAVEELERRNAKPRHDAICAAILEHRFEEARNLVRQVPKGAVDADKYPYCAVRYEELQERLRSLLPISEVSPFPDAVVLLVCYQDAVA